jgi:S1-C subfamily serine protease
LIAIHTSIGDVTADNRHVTMATFRRDWQRMLRGDSWGKLKALNEPGDTDRPGRMGVKVDREASRAAIRAVNAGSGAEDAGLLAGDVVVQFDNVIINDGVHLIEVVKRFKAGDVVKVKIERNGTTIQLEVRLK